MIAKGQLGGISGLLRWRAANTHAVFLNPCHEVFKYICFEYVIIIIILFSIAQCTTLHSLLEDINILPFCRAATDSDV